MRIVVPSIFLFFIVGSFWAMAASAPTVGSARWIVYYDDVLPYEDFKGYDIVAFDSDGYPNFEGVRKDGQVILGYLSTTEAEEYRDYFADIEALDIMLEPSELWDKHIVLDIRNPKWKAYFIETLIPRVLAKGFDGIMLDTIDTVIYLEEEHPEKYAGMKEAAVDLIHSIRAAYPDIVLMQNRGLPILDQVASSLDYVLAESIRVQYNFENDTAIYFDDEIYDEEVAKLKEAMTINPKLQVVTLDYWDMSAEESDTIRKIYEQQRSHGFIPYVTTVDLSKRHEEP